MKVLIIDDEATIREIISSELQNWGFQVYSCENGRKAIQFIERESVPDLMVIDMLMPEKEGIETIIELRRDFPAVKIIAISGGGSISADQVLDYALKLGADAVFFKPIDLDQLAEKAISLVKEKKTAVL